MQRAQELIKEEQMGFGLSFFRKKKTVDERKETAAAAAKASQKSVEEIENDLLQAELEAKKQQEEEALEERKRIAKEIDNQNQAQKVKSDKKLQDAITNANERIARETARDVEKWKKKDNKDRKVQEQKDKKEKKDAQEKAAQEGKEREKIYNTVAKKIYDNVNSFECGHIEDRLTTLQDPYDKIGIKLIKEKCVSDKARKYASHQATYGEKMREKVKEILKPYQDFLALNEEEITDKASLIVIAVYDSRRKDWSLEVRILQILKERES